ncbi:MAG: MFS transporter, partial [Planctomycetes bacterium]|nr:MFS transporter [Planctomycetota bacterium]
MNRLDRTPPDSPLNAAQLVVIGLLGLAAGSAYLTRHCIAVANTTILKELDLTEKQMGWVLGSFALGYFVFQIPGGWLGNRIGTRKAYSLISLLWSAFTVLSSLAFSWFWLLASRIAFGSAQAGMVPISAKIVSDWFHENRRGVCSAVIAASMSIGGVVAMKLTAELMKHYHWRDIFRAYSLVGIFWAGGFWWFFRTRPDEHPWLRGERKVAERREPPGPERIDSTSGVDPAPGRTACAVPLHDEDASAEAEAPQPSEPVDWHRLLRNQTIWAINIQSVFRAAGYWLFGTWFPAFLGYRFGLSATRAGSLATWPLAGVVVGTMIGGFAVDRLLATASNKKASRVGVAAISLFVCGVLSLASAWSPNANSFVLLMSLGAVFSGAANPAAWAPPMDVAGKNTAVGVCMMHMSGTFGCFAVPVLPGS